MNIINPIGGYGVRYTDSGNSTTDNINATPFVGEWSQVPVGSVLIVDLKADQDLTLTIEYSVNGTDVDSALTRHYRTSFIFPPQLFKNARPYVRVSLTNSTGSATTVLRLDSYISDTDILLNIPLDGTMSKDYGAISTRPSNFDAEVAASRRQGWSVTNKFGFNNDVDSASAEVIASFGGSFARMTTADTLDIVSTSANDTSAGTGVQSIFITGINENRDDTFELVTMNGTSTVTTTNQFLGVNRVAIFLAGSGGVNAGDINVTATTAGSTQAQMPAGDGVTQQLILHIPQKHDFLLSHLDINVNKLSGGGSPRVTIKGLVYSAVNNATQEIYRSTIDTSAENYIHEVFHKYLPVTEKTILFFTADTDTNNTIVSGRFGGQLVRQANA